MNTDKRLAIGAMLATVGALGMVLLMFLDGGNLARSWTVPLGFVFGAPAGAGAALSIYALIQKRNER